MSGRKVELDKVNIPSPELESSSSQKLVPVIPTPISEEANDDDHETSEQVTTEPRRSSRVWFTPEWYGNCRCQNWRISGRGSRTMRLGRW